MRYLATAVAATVLLAAGHAFADSSYPNKPITFVVPYPAGGTSDMLARKWADELGKKLKNPVIVENVAGAGGSIGARKVASASADGYTLMVGSVNEIVLAPLALKKPTYKAGDFRPVAITYASPVVLLVNHGHKAKSLQDFVSMAKKEQRFTYGTPGQGTFQHVVFHTLEQRSNTDLLHIPYKGGASFINDTIGGQIDAILLPVVSAVPQLTGGRLRALGVSSAQRSDAIPNVPTFAESTPELKGFDMTVWIGIFAPAKTPMPIIDKLNAAIRETYQTESMQAFVKTGASQIPPSALDLYGAQRFVDAEDRRYRVTIPGMKLDD